MEETEIYSQPIGMVIDGKHTTVTIKLTEKAFRLVCEDIRRNEPLWKSFRATIESLREIDRLNLDAPSVPLATEEMILIGGYLETHIPYGKALYVPFIEHARKVGLEY
ncbi:hypothetical protein [Rhizobium giardinii]|uniref:hypothetical protein n=1 Tax=Rhizobium giardinii TaxID=56731 RepID=UPI003D6F5FE4